MKPMYHAKALELLRSKPDSSNLGAVSRGEERLGLRLPAAVREFFANPELTALVDRKAGDHLCPLEVLTSAPATAASIEQSGDTAILVFMFENQGIFLWGALLDGSEDPPVVVRENEDNAPWVSCCDRFSIYVYTRVFENQFWSTDKQGKGINCAYESFEDLSAKDIRFLRTRFREEPKTVGPPCVIHRFSQGWGKRLWIYDTDYGAHIAIAASDAVNFEELKVLLQPRWDFSSAV